MWKSYFVLLSRQRTEGEQYKKSKFNFKFYIFQSEFKLNITITDNTFLLVFSGNISFKRSTSLHRHKSWKRNNCGLFFFLNRCHLPLTLVPVTSYYQISWTLSGISPSTNVWQMCDRNSSWSQTSLSDLCKIENKHNRVHTLAYFPFHFLFFAK